MPLAVSSDCKARAGRINNNACELCLTRLTINKEFHTSALFRAVRKDKAMLFYGKTDVGKRRSANQDDFIIKKYSEDTVMAVVCDGMGGANGGNIASAVASEAFLGVLDEGERENPSFFGMDEEKIIDWLTAAVDVANSAVYEKAEENPSLDGMGTTLVGCILSEDKLYVVNVGDSRLYVVRSWGVEQISHDHSYVQYLVDLGKMTPEEAKHSKNKNLITRAIGTEESVEADAFISTLDCGDTVLLCSDGLSNLVEPAEMSDVVMAGVESGDLMWVCDRLISLANDRGGHDNITAVLLSI